MSPQLQQLIDAAQNEGRQLDATLRAIKSHSESKRVIIETGDDSTETLANECEHLLMFIEGIGDWEIV
jgi:hypothetical protein